MLSYRLYKSARARRRWQSASFFRLWHQAEYFSEGRMHCVAAKLPPKPQTWVNVQKRCRIALLQSRRANYTLKPANAPFESAHFGYLCNLGAKLRCSAYRASRDRIEVQIVEAIVGHKRLTGSWFPE
ncbi:hypothetical protein BN2475_780001 [Paraburkholderia ribeironis]|uniref:Uncharacterized protein n=1 Tax=Paraburkholderia ribeironis TaxID=1247936 RepID=A0A1N7SJY6_9BURK|nr:hypothetical protein BN2475_780001 [Paraburkholderia ribeironis]